MRRAPGRSRRPAPPPEPLPVPVVDAHCHLDLMGAPVAEALATARAVGVRGVVTIGIDLPTSRWAADVAATRDDVVAAVAVHPNDVADIGEPEWAEIARLAALPQVRAVGETGLDHYRTEAPLWGAQEESFRRHIAIAKATGKPLVIHDREAHDDVVRVLDAEGAPEMVVFHCFSGDAGFAALCAERGWVMSFAGNLTFASASPLRQAAALAPAELLLVETDAPFLAPVPHRGRPNAPSLLPHTVRALAAVRGTSVEAVADAVRRTAARIFGLGEEGADGANEGNLAGLR